MTSDFLKLVIIADKSTLLFHCYIILIMQCYQAKILLTNAVGTTHQANTNDEN